MTVPDTQALRSCAVGSGLLSRGIMRARVDGPLAPLILKSLGNRQPEIDSCSAARKVRAGS